MVWAIFIGIFAAIFALISTITTGSAIESYKRHRDRKMLASALRAEILSNMSVIKTLNYLKDNYIEKFSEEMKSDEIWLPERNRDFPFDLSIIYSKSLDKIGLLPQEITTKIIFLYANYTVFIQLFNRAFGSEGRDSAQRGRMALRTSASLKLLTERANNLSKDLNKCTKEEWYPIGLILNTFNTIKQSKIYFNKNTLLKNNMIKKYGLYIRSTKIFGRIFRS